MKTIKSGILYRSFDLDRKSVNVEARTVELSFASENPCERYFGNEILDCSPGSVDMSRMNGGAPLLMEHNRDDVVGVCVGASCTPDKMCRGTFRFGKSARATEILTDVADGIRSLVSVGYRVRKMVTEKIENGVETLRATSWMPLEASIVSVPLDPSVGVGRSGSNEQYEIEVESMRNLKLDPAPSGGGGGGGSPPAAPPVISRAEALAEARRDLNKRDAEIRAMAKTAKLEDYGEECIRADMSIDEFRVKAFEKVCQSAGSKPIQATETSEVGMTDKEIRQYSLVKAIRQAASKQPLDGIEKEASDAVAKNIRQTPKGFFVPMDITARSFAESRGIPRSEFETIRHEIAQLRALVPNVFSAGGALIATDLLMGSMIDLLRNNMQVMALGARNLTGLVGDVAIPRVTGGATAYWLGVGAAVTRSQQAVGQLALTPHRLAAATAYDKQLMIQTSLSVEQFVRQDLMEVLALEKDRAAINGSGVSGEPLGILNTTGLSTPVTFATAASPLFTEIIKFETNLATNNADRGNLGFLVHPTVRGFLKGWPKFASTGTPIWENDTLNSYPARSTNQVPVATSTIFGRWDDLIIADWDGMDVVVDPYTLSLNGQIGIVIQMFTDIGIRHAVSFAVSTN